MGCVDTEVLETMARTRAIISDGLALRMQKSDTEQQIKIRQPLAELVYDGEKLPEFYEQIIADEVNVKKIVNGDKLHLDKVLTDELLEEGFVRELVRGVQAARKKAGLVVDDKIKLSVSEPIPERFVDSFREEILATELNETENYTHDEIVKINGKNVTISFEKA